MSDLAGDDIFNLRDRWHESGLRTAGEQRLDRLAAAGAVIEGPVIDVHPDEPVGERPIQVAPELQGISDRRGSVVETVLNRFLEHVGDLLHRLASEVFANAVAAEW